MLLFSIDTKYGMFNMEYVFGLEVNPKYSKDILAFSSQNLLQIKLVTREKINFGHFTVVHLLKNNIKY